MLRVVAAGCGRMSQNFLLAAQQAGGIELVGFVDTDLARAEDRRATFAPGAAIGPDLAEKLRRVNPDAVFDIVVPAARQGVAQVSLGHGCHILTEKPMAGSMADAHALVDAARQARRVHAVVQNRRYHPGVRRIARFLRSGALGRVTGIYCDFFLGPHFGGFREEMEHVLLLDMAIHTFDVARLFTGNAPDRVHCLEWNPANSWYSHGASAIATFQMPDGAVVSYRGSWCAEGLRTSWDAAWRIVGERGTLTWDGEGDMRAEVVSGPDALFAKTATVAIPELDSADRVGGHLGVIQDFIQAIATGTPPETAGAENIKSLGMVLGAIGSAETGQTVDLTTGAYRP